MNDLLTPIYDDLLRRFPLVAADAVPPPPDEAEAPDEV